MKSHNKPRKIKHRTGKFFGWPNEKWAKGGGKNGYGRAYGRNKHGFNGIVDFRTKDELMNAHERKGLE